MSIGVFAATMPLWSLHDWHASTMAFSQSASGFRWANVLYMRMLAAAKALIAPGAALCHAGSWDAHVSAPAGV